MARRRTAMDGTRGAAVAVALAALTCLSCKPHKEPEKVVLPGDNVVLADVNGSTVTQYDVDHAARAMFSAATVAELNAEGKKKVLESLVRSRAIAQKREAELTTLQRAELERQVAAYREEQLVRQYLDVHTRMQPVTGEMVASYYQQHPEKFGATTKRNYELIMSSRELADSERAAMIEALTGAGGHEDWSAWVAQLQKAHQPVAYQRGQGDEAVLHPNLRAVLDRLPVGQSSPLTFVEGRAYVLRVLDETHAQPKPLPEVSAEIRKTLMPVQLSKSVQQAAELALKDAKVSYR